MIKRHNWFLTVLILVITMFLGIGFAEYADVLSITGEVTVSPLFHDVYISKVSPTESNGTQINHFFNTVLSSKTISAGTSSFTVTITNASSKIYVFERIIDGNETDIEGVYNGTDIQYEISGLTALQEIAPNGGTIIFNLTIKNPKGIKTDFYFLDFNFLEKTGTEILPGEGSNTTIYDVTFNPNNGEPIQTLRVNEGSLLTAPEIPTKNGYTFIGWYKDISLVNAWDFSVDTVTSSIILYAGWQRNELPPVEPDPENIQYEVMFKYNNGADDITVIVDEGTLLTKPTDPTYQGYTFLGWYKDASLMLPWNFESDIVEANIILYAKWKNNNASTDEYNQDFLGLVDALLSQNPGCLNESDIIYEAVLESLTNNKRPSEDAPILHCGVNSISGGTMKSIAQQANITLTKNLQFIFEVDPDPQYQNNRLRLYMYYDDDCINAKAGDEILVYKQILTKDTSGTWHTDGTYIGRATVGYYFGGGNNGKDMWTIDAYSWKAGAPEV